MKLQKLVEKLAAYQPSDSEFISLYLAAEANTNGRDNYRIWLRNAFREESENYSDGSEEAKALQKVFDKINEFIENDVDASANGIAVFASVGSEEFFETVQLDASFSENSISVYDRPHIFPLVRIIEQNPKFCVLWADTHKAAIYVFGGEKMLEIETGTKAKVEEIENQKTQRTKVGGWSQARYQRHIENFHLQHAKETVEELEKLMRERKMEHLILCGDETGVIPVLRPQLSKDVEEKISGVINMSQYASEDEIREKTKEIMMIENAVRDKAQVERMFDAARAAAGLGTLGVDKTLAALSNGQVEELFIDADFAAIEYSTKKVRRVLKNYAPGDDNSASDELPKVKDARQIADELLIRALNSAAGIVFVEDDSILKEAGGVGAILRYNLSAMANG